MSAAAWVWLAVGIATLLLMAGLILGLIRHLKALSATVTRFQEDVEPVMERLRAESAMAQDRADRLPERVPKRGTDARIRR
jgi:hypothetical protein